MRHIESLLRKLLAVTLLTVVTVPLLPAVVSAESTPVPTAVLDIPASGQLGEQLAFTVTLSNAAVGTTGYGPYVDLLLSPGADGDDGLSFVAAEALGVALVPFGERAVCTGNELFDHPLTELPTPCAEGEEIIVLQLPFLSLTGAQAPLVINVTADVSNAADVGFALTVRARAGFFLGTDAENTPISDPPIVQATAVSASYNPIVWRLIKSLVNSREDETATGPNFPRRYTLALDISSGQTLTQLQLRDTLPDSMQFVELVSVTTADISTTYTVISSPLTTEPGGTLLIEFDRVRGSSSGSDVAVVIEYYIARLDAADAEVLSHVTGDDVDVTNTVTTSASWDPRGPGDATATIQYTPNNGDNEHTLHQRSIALFKDVTPLGGEIVAPGQQARYDLTFDVSDYFAFSDVVLEDTLPDGLRFDDSVTPTLTCRMHGATIGPLSFSGTTMTVNDNWTDVNGAAAPNPGEPASSHDINPAVNDGTTTIAFRVSELLIEAGGNGKLIGGGIPPTGTGAGALPNRPPLYAAGTTCDLSFTALISDRYTDDYPSGDYSVDQNDNLPASAIVGGTLLNVTNLNETAYSESDGSAATFSISGATIEKSIYALNGNTSCLPGDCSGGVNTVVAPGDQITFRLKMELTTSDIEELRIADVLPPYFDLSPTAQALSRISSIAMITGTTPPAVGTARLGPDDDFFAESGITPTVTNDVAAGVITFDYGSYDDPDDTPNVIDLLLTLTVDFQPVKDRQLVYNNMAQLEGSTNSGDHRVDAGETFLLLAPELSMRKGVIAVDDSTAASHTFDYPLGFNVNEADACATRLGSGTSARFVASQLTAATLNADVTSIDAGDRVTFGILVQNDGSAPFGAFDVSLRDELPDQLSFVDGSICVHRIDSNSVLSYTPIDGGLFDVDGGIMIDDLSEPLPEIGAINAGRDYQTGDALVGGQGLLLVSYQATVDTDAGNGTDMNSEATLFHYASRQDGPDFSLIDLSDNAAIRTAIPEMSFDLLATSEAHTDAADLAIGEIARVRTTARLPEGVHPNAMLLVDLPEGLTFIDDGTARLALVSNGSGITASSFPTASLTISGTEVTTGSVAADDVTFVLPDSAVSKSSAIDSDNYAGGNDVYFKFGTLTNSDRDADGEFVVVDFNVLMNNSSTAANQAGDVLQPAVDIYVDGSQANADAGTLNLQVVESQISMTYDVTPLSGEAGDTLTYTLTIENAESATTVTAFDLLLNGQLSEMLISPTLVSVTPTVSAGAELVSGTLTVTATELAPGRQMVIVLRAVLGDTVQAGLPVTGTVGAEWTSLPGTAGTQSNVTGSRVTGAAGATNGERDASSSVTDYQATAENELTINGADLSLAIGASSDAVTTGSTLTIGEIVTATIAVHLPGGTTPDLRLTTFIPAGVSYLTGSQTLITGTYNGTVLSPTLTTTGGSGADLLLDFDTLVLPADSDAANNTFTVTLQLQLLNIAGNSGLSAAPAGVQAAPTTRVISAALQVAALPAVNSDPQSLSVVEPELEAALTFSDAIVDPGDNVTVTLTLTNTGSASAYDITISNLLTDTVLSNAIELFTPTGFSSTLAAATPSSGLSTLSYSGTSLAVGASVTMTYRVTLPLNLASGRRITNTAVLQRYSSLAGTVVGERTATPLTVTAQLSISAINLSISKSDGLSTAAPGNTLVYTLTAANIGNIDGSGVVVTETVPANTSFVAADSSAGWSCADGSGAGSLCRYEIGTLNIAAEQELTFAVMVSSTIPAGIAAITNTATIADNGARGADDVPADNTVTDVDVLDAAPDLEVTLSDNGAVPLPGQAISYTINYSNTGSQDARGVVLRSTVPANMTYRRNGSSTGWSCADGAVAGKPCRLTIGDLAVGTTGTVTLTMVVNYPFPAGVISVSHTVTAADNAANGGDPTPENNQATAVSELSPTSITLVSFMAARTDGGVQIDWVTGTEVDTFGFLIYRGVTIQRRDAVLVTPQLILSRGRDGQGAAYRMVDTTAGADSSALYWVVEVERSGRRNEHGPLPVLAPPPPLPQLYIPFAVR